MSADPGINLIIAVILSIVVVTILSKYFVKGNTADDYNSEGLMFLNKSRYDKALIYFQKAYEIEEGSWQKKVMHLRNIGLAYHGLGDSKSVLKTKKNELKLCQKNTYDYYIALGDLDLIEKNIQSAIDNFEKAIIINPDRLEANNSLGLILIGDYGLDFINLEQALVCNHRALEAYPFNITKNVLGRNYFLLKDYVNADKYFSEILKEYPNNLETRYSLGLIKYYLSDYESAKKLLSQVAQYNPEYFKNRNEILKDLNIKL